MPQSEHNLGFLFWQISNHWQRLAAHELKPLDLTPTQFLLLSGIETLSQSEDAINQRALAKHTGADIMMTSKLLRTLEKEGMVLRAANHQDSRALSILLTGKGRARLNQAQPLIEKLTESYFKQLKPEGLSKSLLTHISSIEEPDT